MPDALYMRTLSLYNAARGDFLAKADAGCVSFNIPRLFSTRFVVSRFGLQFAYTFLRTQV